MNVAINLNCIPKRASFCSELFQARLTIYPCAHIVSRIVFVVGTTIFYVHAINIYYMHKY